MARSSPERSERARNLLEVFKRGRESREVRDLRGGFRGGFRGDIRGASRGDFRGGFRGG